MPIFPGQDRLVSETMLPDATSSQCQEARPNLCDDMDGQ